MHLFKSIESDHDRGFCPCEPTLRDPSPHGVSLDEEPIRKSAVSKDGVKSLERNEVTQKSPNEYQGRSNSS